MAGGGFADMTRPRPQTAIISKAAKYVNEKRIREEADAKARSEGLSKWPASPGSVSAGKPWSYK